MTKVKSLLAYLLEYFHAYKKTALFAVVVIISTLFYFMKSTGNENFETFTVISKNLEEAVTLTGRVKPSEEANISFEKTGIVSDVFVKAGDKVNKGDKIASLKGEDAEAKVQEASANLESQASLLQQYKGSERAEIISIKESSLLKAKNDLIQSYKNSGDSLRNISISGNTYVRENFASLYSGGKIEGYRINVPSCDSTAENKVNQLRKDAEVAISDIETKYANYLESNDPLAQEKILNEVKTSQMKTISFYIDSMKDLFSLSCLAQNPNYDSIRATIFSSRNNWSVLTSDLSNKLNLIATAKTIEVQAEKDLEIAKNGESVDKIRQQQAQVNAAYARLLSAKAEAGKNILLAPFGGVITNIDIKKGELVSPGGKTISLISDSNFEIESKVSEVDVAKLATGSKAVVSFDAYGEDFKFEAIVANISLAGIISDGVPTFKTIFAFLDSSDKIKSGLTANIKVSTKIHENVLSIPAKFIKNENGVKSVLVKAGDDLVKRSIETGVRGISGEIEILSGLKSGEVIVLEK